MAKVKPSAIEIESKAKQLEKVWNGEEIRRSISLFLKASKLRVADNNFHTAAENYLSIAKLKLQLSQNYEAMEFANKSLNYFKKVNDLDGVVKSLCLISSIYQLKGLLKKSKSFYEKALSLSKEASEEVKSQANLAAGKYQTFYGSLDKALEHYQTAFLLCERSVEIDLKAEILLNLAIINIIKGEKKDSLERINSALELWQNIESKRGIALANNTLGFIYTLTNEKKSALHHYNLALNEIPFGIDLIEKANAYNGIAVIHYDYNQYERAVANAQEAMNLFEKAEYDLGKLLTINFLAKVLSLSGKTEQSKELYKIYIKLADKQGTLFLKSAVVEALGDIDFNDKEIDQALKKFIRSLQIRKSMGVPFPILKNKIGKIYEIKSDLRKARNYYQNALNESRKIEDIIQVGESLYNLANLDFVENKLDSALVHSTEALEVTESIFRDVSNQNLRQSFFSNSYDRYELHIKILMNLHDLFPNKGFEIKALQTSEKARSRLMRENLKLSDEDLTLDADQSLVEKEQKLNHSLIKKKEKLTKLIGKKNSKLIVSKLKAKIAQLDNKLQSIKAELRETSPMYSSIKNPADFEYTEFQNEILDKQTVLLEFFFGKEKSYVWVIENDQINVYTLLKSDVINNKIDELQKILISVEELPKGTIEDRQEHLFKLEEEYWNQAAKISQILFGQFSNKLSDKKILVVPDGKLRSFPISALPNPDKKELTPFLMTNEIIYEPSAALLYLLKAKRKNINSPQKDFLIFSDPVLSTDDKRLNDQIKSFKNEQSTIDESQPWNDVDTINELENLKRLKASGVEAKNIFNHYDQSSSKIVQGFKANRENLLKENIWNYKVLHFATHGLFNDEVPELSGIVLSRFDEKGNKKNGLIWLQDIYRLRLSTDLVVLSACQTAAGKEIKGEGLMSLTNGFLQAGAKSIISSHWKVDDDRTQKLMNSFYHILSEDDITPSKALQKAKINMYQNPNNRFPFYWAAFTFHGDFQNIPKLTKKTNYSIYMVCIFILLFLFSTYILLKKPFKT